MSSATTIGCVGVAPETVGAQDVSTRARAAATIHEMRTCFMPVTLSLDDETRSCSVRPIAGARRFVRGPHDGSVARRPGVGQVLPGSDVARADRLQVQA